MIRSQVQYRPVVIAATTISNAPPTAIEGPNTEETQAGAYADKFGDQRQKISKHQITHGKEAPEFSEAVEDQFRMSSVGNGPQTDGHFLNDETHHESEHDEGNEKTNAETRTVAE